MPRKKRAAENVNEPLARLMAVVAGSGFDLPEEMLREIEAISIEGVDPQWQVIEMEKILDRWARRH